MGWAWTSPVALHFQLIEDRLKHSNLVQLQAAFVDAEIKVRPACFSCLHTLLSRATIALRSWPEAAVLFGDVTASAGICRQVVKAV
jgi:hypothetical protein